MNGIIPIYSILTSKQFEIIRNNSFKFFPERFFTKPLSFFKDKEHAIRVAKEKNNSSKTKECTHLVKLLFLTNTYLQFSEENFFITNREKISKLNAGIVGLIELEEKFDIS